MKKKYSALPELLLRSIFYTLINYVLLSMVLSFRLHWSSILFSAAMLWFALDYSKTSQQLTGKRLLADLLWLGWPASFVAGTVIPYFCFQKIVREIETE